MSVVSYKDLIVWQKAMDLAEEVYKLSQSFPKEEVYSLTNQIRRAVVSIASNIAEGAGRSSRKEFGNFLSISNGSACELITQLEIANRVNLLNDAAFQVLKAEISEIQKMNRSLRHYVSGELSPTRY